MALPLIYNWRNLFVRKTSSLLTFGVVAAIVFVLTWSLAFAEGIRAAVTAGGSERKLVVLKPGATGESTSIISLEEANQLAQLPGLATDEHGQPLLSREMITQTNFPARVDPATQQMPVAVRGVDPIAFTVHPVVRVVEGRRFEPGANEVIVGKAILARVVGLNIGEVVTLGFQGTLTYRVVGTFEAEGGALESEIWGPRSSLERAFGRQMLSSVALGLSPESETADVIRKIKAPPFQLNAKTERGYYQEIADKSAQLVEMTLVLVAFMAMGACFAVANTFYAAVDARTKEIAMLRTLGFGRAAIVGAFLVESLLLCGTACVAGAFGALAIGRKEDAFMAEATWSTFACTAQVTPTILLIAFGAAMTVAIIGAFVPALRAARLPLVSALRQA